jgi:hypothetical protein
MSGYQAVYRSILDSTIARDHVARHVLEDLLKLADYRTGIVDMTIDAIARRTNVPEELVRHGIEELEKPDPDSRCKIEGGRRLVRLDPERAWGWRIVTYTLHQEEVKRDGNRRRQAEYKDRKSGGKRGLPGRPKNSVTEGALPGVTEPRAAHKKNPVTEEEEERRIKKKKGKERGAASRRPLSGFVAPSIEEVRKLIAEKGWTFDPVRFVKVNQSKLWEGIRDWRAAAEAWQANEKAKPEPPPTGQVRQTLNSLAELRPGIDYLAPSPAPEPEEPS